MSGTEDGARERVARWLADNYGEHPVRAMEPWRKDAAELLSVVADTTAGEAEYTLEPPLAGLVGDSVIADLHAKWHDEPGNLMGPEDCGYDGCEVYAVLKAAAPALVARSGGAQDDGLRVRVETLIPRIEGVIEFDMAGERYDAVMSVQQVLEHLRRALAGPDDTQQDGGR